MDAIKNFLKKYTPLFLLRGLYRLGGKPTATIPSGRIRRGHLKRTQPFSTMFGYDRHGGPVDRFYIEGFLKKENAAVRGRVLEIEDDEYTLRFGGDKVTKADILHIDDSNPRATFVGDLSDAPQLPDNSFDCIILTQTLHLIYDFRAAVATCHRILKPGGALLLTVPGITPIDHGEWHNIWYWSFTEASIKRILSEQFPASHTVVESKGNVAMATAFLYGMGLGDVSETELFYNDPYYPVIITAKSVKP